jgi:hypothetical protein
MGATSEDWAKLIGKLQTVVCSTRSLAAHWVPVSDDVPGIAAGCKTLEALGAELQTIAGQLRRRAVVSVIVTELGKTSGAPIGLDTFISKCRPEDLDYLLALREAARKCSTGRDRGWLVEVYLRCREVALGRDPDAVGEPDGSLDGPDVPGNLDPPKPVDYR